VLVEIFAILFGEEAIGFGGQSLSHNFFPLRIGTPNTLVKKKTESSISPS
jgi:hypothetical protein